MSEPSPSVPSEPHSGERSAAPADARVARGPWQRALSLVGLGSLSRCQQPGEGEACFLQQRIALFAKVCALVSLLFFVTGIVVLQFSPSSYGPTALGRGFHALGLLLSLGIWLATSRGCWSARALYALDAGGTLLVLSAYAMMGLTNVGTLVMRSDLEMTLVGIIMLMLRAVIVPSGAAHTALVTALGTIPVLVVSVSMARANTGAWPEFWPYLSVVFAGVWSVAAVAMTALTSRVIYHLRVRVQEAQQLGQYVLDEKIGEGGMGAVYRARHALLRRPTAVKLILPERAGKLALARFEREVQMTAMLTHPNTVSVFDYGRTPDGIFYYAMEYLEGVNLEELVARFGPQPPARVVHVLEQIAGALAEAHHAGLVHRDVKPANIILCERGHVLDIAKVFDFGLVKAIDAEASADPKLSRVDGLVGTPMYLAPEALLDAESIDARTDLYALGAVGYFLLTGKPVFEGKSVLEIGAQHLHAAPVPPGERLGQPVPAELERILLRCLEKEPGARFQSAGELRDALLASGVPAWTQADAQAFWSEHPLGDKGAPAAAEGSGGSTMVIELAARAAWG